MSQHRKDVKILVDIAKSLGSSGTAEVEVSKDWINRWARFITNAGPFPGPIADEDAETVMIPAVEYQLLERVYSTESAMNSAASLFNRIYGEVDVGVSDLGFSVDSPSTFETSSPSPALGRSIRVGS